MKRHASVGDYIRSSPAPARRLLRRLRAVIREAAPEASQRISYGMPAFFQDGVLVYFAAFESHVGLYGGARSLGALESQARRYRTGKGTLRFPLDRPIPAALVKRIVTLRVRQNAARARRR